MSDALPKGTGSALEPFHAFDLPQVYQKPSARQLLDALAKLVIPPPSWDHGAVIEAGRIENGAAGSRSSKEEIVRYLTSIVASELGWIEDQDARDEIYHQASLRLSERSGRTAMPAMTRTFRIPSGDDEFHIQIHEPALTADNLGFKTWAASYLLARRLHTLDLPQSTLHTGEDGRLQVLELGSGTGLVGISAAAVLGASVFLTDLREITGNLNMNAISNAEVVAANGGATTTAILDWNEPPIISPTGSVSAVPKEFPLILAADSIYSADHPAMFANTVKTWLSPHPSARTIVELPIRPGFSKDHDEFRLRMSDAGLICLEQGHEVGYDDWISASDVGEPQEVDCWWSIWGWRSI